MCSMYHLYCRCAPMLLCFVAWRDEPLQLGNCSVTLGFPRAKPPSFFFFRRRYNKQRCRLESGLRLKWKVLKYISLYVHLDQPGAILRTNLPKSSSLFPQGQRPSWEASLQLGRALLWVLAQQQLHITAHTSELQAAPRRPRGLLLLLP